MGNLEALIHLNHMFLELWEETCSRHTHTEPGAGIKPPTLKMCGCSNNHRAATGYIFLSLVVYPVAHFMLCKWAKQWPLHIGNTLYNADTDMSCSYAYLSTMHH